MATFDQANSIVASVPQLDILELLRSGGLPAYPLDAPVGTVTLRLPRPGDRTVEVVEITDLEGVPIARVTLNPGEGQMLTRGHPTWLARRSSRPFERLHLAPGEVKGHSGLVALCAPAPAAEVRAALDAAGPRPLLLALASLDGDLDHAALQTAQQVRLLAGEHPGATAAIAPVPACLGPSERDAVLDAYAHGASAVLLGQAPAVPAADAGTVLFFTGLSGSGKSTLARAVRNRLIEEGECVSLLDGDVVRRHLSAGLGFSPADRDTNIRRIGWVAAEIAHHGGTVICSPIAPFDATRKTVREMAQRRGDRFVLIHVATPLAECERRDRKGLYARARRGQIADFTGISSPYEEPEDAELRLDTTGQQVDQLVEEIVALLGRSC